MMTSVLCKRVSRWIRSTRSVRSLRLFSTAGSSGSDEPFVAVSPHTPVGPRTVWPDETMGPFGPQDKRFQLPGNVGFDCHLRGTDEERATSTQRSTPDVLTAPSNSERHEFILAQFITEYQTKDASVWKQRVAKAEEYFTHCDVECSVHTCPELLKQELESFFPALPVTGITVLTIKQKTIRTEELNTQQLLDIFINGAKQICFLLWRGGYWADFIDPWSGRAYFGAESHDPVLQTDQRRHSGFHIEDLASCRLTVHLLSDSHTFAGTLITSAPSDSLLMRRLTGHTPT
ncbi:metabolism of cobalamin associated Da [Tachysurus fulvidraco]|uniref:metabolism of cobalamin associated Da n=1 Tax=Tachysurus fulvidraco TaxID=1234273 RepID=UPI001FF039B5|nr:metabolism of cobalamin associated Da [Tachysurus fulvidraco]XP_047675934.1 metabolism of cobalamin associated Da [Tachysurus fulvidraco]